MVLLKKCDVCNVYTLKVTCPHCGLSTVDPAYKFSKIRDEPPRAFKRRKN